MPDKDDDFWDKATKGEEKSNNEEPKKTSELEPEPTTETSVTETPKKEQSSTVDDPFVTQDDDEETPEEPQTTTNETPTKTQEVVETPKKEETKKESPQTKTAVDDPFETETLEEPVTTETTEEKLSTPTTQSSTPKGDPFVDEKEVSQIEKFKKTKPATSGKNLSFMIFGKKGTTKTSTALSLPGKIFAISMDQQTAIIHEEFYNNDKRIQVWDGIEFFNSKDPETKLETATETVEYINWLLENPCTEFKPDWILIDGTERLSHVCEMAMRAQENLLPYEGVKNRNAWKYRNDLINNVHQRAVQIAKLGVVYTAFTYIETVTTATGEEKREGPKWAGDIEQKTQIVIKTSSERTQNGRSFVAEVESSKVSFIPTGKRVVVGERLNSGEIQNKIGIKGLFTPRGIKKYFLGGEQ